MMVNPCSSSSSSSKKRKLDTRDDIDGASTDEKTEDLFARYGMTPLAYGKKNFTQAAIDSLEETIFGETTEEEDKAVFLIGTNSFGEGWLKLQSHDDECRGEKYSISTFYDKMNKDQENGFPPELLNFRWHGCAAWGSYIIIAGGTYMCPRDSYLSNSVYMYDTVTGRWKQLPPMICHRRLNPIIVVADDKIFAFGGDPRHENMRIGIEEIELWAEYYDLTSETRGWNRFPRLSGTTFPRHPLFDHVLYPKGSQILFWMTESDDVISFNYSTWEWRTFDAPESSCIGPYMNASAIVYDHFLFWYDYRTIYAHDLSVADGVTLPVYIFGDSIDDGPTFDFDRYSSISDPRFLVRMGKDLCLFWRDDKNIIQYFIFRVQIGRGVGLATLKLVPGPSGLLEVVGLLEDLFPFIRIAVEVSVKKETKECMEICEA